MNKIALINEANKVQNIVNIGKLTVDDKEIDITEPLKMWEATSYRADDIDNIDITKFSKSDTQCIYKITYDGSDSIMFNSRYKTDDERYLQKRMCVLNFASSKNPGGGFVRGCMAQEEALCQASNLYSILERHMPFYEYNREHICKGLYTDGIIFVKNCLFFRNKYKNVEPQLVDVITCAAPNFKAARRNGISEDEINQTMDRRVEQILKVAIANNVKVLALGAFGCGVFHNNPNTVANIMKTLLIDKGYSKYFEEIVFPMNESSGKNVSAFLKCFKNIK